MKQATKTLRGVSFVSRRVGLAVGFWTALPLWGYELLVWMGYLL